MYGAKTHSHTTWNKEQNVWVVIPDIFCIKHQILCSTQSEKKTMEGWTMLQNRNFVLHRHPKAFKMNSCFSRGHENIRYCCIFVKLKLILKVYLLSMRRSRLRSVFITMTKKSKHTEGLQRSFHHKSKQYAATVLY